MPDFGVGGSTPAASGTQARTRAHLHGAWPALALLVLAGCATPPAPPAARQPDLNERFAIAWQQLLPVGRIMEEVAAQDADWPLGERARLVSAAQLGCMRTELGSERVQRTQREQAARYASQNAATLQADTEVLEAGAARLVGGSMLAGATPAGTAPAPSVIAQATPAERLALVAFLTEPRYDALRRGTGLTQLPAGGAKPGDPVSRGRNIGRDLSVQFMGRAMRQCNIPVQLIF